MLMKSSSLLFGCYSTVRGRVCSLVVGVDAPRSISDLWCEVYRIGALLLGEEPLSTPPQEVSNEKCALWYLLSPVMWAHKVQLLALPLGLPQLLEFRQMAGVSLR